MGLITDAVNLFILMCAGAGAVFCALFAVLIVIVAAVVVLGTIVESANKPGEW